VDTPLVELRKVTKSYGAQQVLRGVDLRVAAGSVVAIVGPSGCGKSTLLRCINYLERPDEGCVLFRGKVLDDDAESLRAHRARVGMVFQRFHLFPHLRVLDNLLLAPGVVRGEGSGHAEERARSLLEKVGLASMARAWPDALSGGQQQRVAIARCLMMEPELLLFDEPTSALDPELVGEVLGVIRDLAEEGRSMCIVTHEMSFAREVASEVVMLDQGMVLEQGPPAKVLGNPQQVRTRVFLKRVLEHSRD
jgi:polar amino acid transport system ATP-binding protein